MFVSKEWSFLKKTFTKSYQGDAFDQSSYWETVGGMSGLETWFGGLFIEEVKFESPEEILTSTHPA